jgi:hypothetical protein
LSPIGGLRRGPAQRRAMEQLPSHLCVFCGELASSRSFQLPPAGADGSGVAAAHDPAAASAAAAAATTSAAAALQEMLALLGSLSAVPPRTYEVTETQLYDPVKQVLFRVQRLQREGSSGADGMRRRRRRRRKKKTIAPDLMCARATM